MTRSLSLSISQPGFGVGDQGSRGLAVCRVRTQLGTPLKFHRVCATSHCYRWRSTFNSVCQCILPHTRKDSRPSLHHSCNTNLTMPSRQPVTCLHDLPNGQQRSSPHRVGRGLPGELACHVCHYNLNSEKRCIKNSGCTSRSKLQAHLLRPQDQPFNYFFPRT